jgi:hypothetical protein
VSRVFRINFFSFLYCPLIFFAQPHKYCLSVRIFPCHLSIIVWPSTMWSHISFTISIKSSLSSHPNSHLNIGCVAVKDDSPVFRRRGVWFETPLVRARTVVRGYFSSHSVVTRMRSSFSKVGLAKLFAHVYFLLDNSISFKFSTSMTALNKKCHLAW